MVLDCFLAKPEDKVKIHKRYCRAATTFRPSILNVALTCRFLSEPALDVLWWAMDDLIPLFNLLPGFQNGQEVGTVSYPNTREI